MTKTEHCVAAEDVMALMDGELSAGDARVVSEHVEQCGECALMAEQLRGVSEALSRWSVPAVPMAVEESVEERLARLSSRRRKIRVRFSLRQMLTIGGVAAGALVMFFLVAVLPRLDERHAKMQTTDRTRRERYAGPPSLMVMPEQSHAVLSPSIAGMAGMSRGAADKFGGGSLGSLTDAPAPMIARTISLTILVKDVEAARGSLDSILTRHGGYSALLNVSSPEGGASNVRASLRVPATELAPAVAELKALGRVVNESQSGEEVSQQHADLVARLKTARETETRFQAILAERTGKVSDVLEVEQSIARVRGEIEQMEAEQKALEHRVDFATVEVQLVEEYKAKLESPAATSVSTRMHNAFVAGYNNATGSLVDLVLFAEEYGPPVLMWLAILGVPTVAVWRRYKKRRAAR